MLDLIVVKLNHFTGLGTHHVVVVLATVQLKYGVAAVEIVSLNQARLFELS